MLELTINAETNEVSLSPELIEKLSEVGFVEHSEKIDDHYNMKTMSFTSLDGKTFISYSTVEYTNIEKLAQKGLTEELNDAVDAEDYEKAAEIKKDIDNLKN